jgi:lipoate-protein ligase A
MHIDTFKQKLINHIKSEFPEILETQLNSFQEGEIQRLVQEKYQNWEWNFGYSPKYSISGTINQNESETKMNIHFHKGFIKEIESDYKIPDIEQLIGLQHEKKTLNSAMKLILPDSIRKELLSIFF